jgi:hypothetical protein
MPTSTRQTFDVSPPSPIAPLSLVLMACVLPLVLIGLTAGREVTRWTSAPYAIVGTIAFIVTLTGVLLWLMQRRSATLENGTLHVVATMYSKRIAATEIDFSKASVVSLDERTELRPGWKTNGYATFGFSAGHFSMRQGLGKGFCLLTQRQRVLWLPLRDGKQHLLLSLERPQALLDALQLAAQHSH